MSSISRRQLLSQVRKLSGAYVLAVHIEARSEARFDADAFEQAVAAYRQKGGSLGLAERVGLSRERTSRSLDGVDEFAFLVIR